LIEAMDWDASLKEDSNECCNSGFTCNTAVSKIINQLFAGPNIKKRVALFSTTLFQMY